MIDADLDIDALAHHPDPYPRYAQLRRRGLHRAADGRWVAATAADIAEVLTAPSAVVGFKARSGPLADLQARMARFSDGPDHARRRAHAERLLQGISPGDLRRHAAALTRARVAGCQVVDVMADVARHVPVHALADALGVADPDAAVTATRRLCLALAPPHDAAPVDAHEAAAHLRDLLAPTVPGPAAARDDAVVNALALLFQAMDATAGLIGGALLAAHRDRAASDVAEAARHDPPVQLTTRIMSAALHVGGRTIPAGDRVVVLLASANRDERHARPGNDERPAASPDDGAAGHGARGRHAAPNGDSAGAFTFGAGVRRCPGSAHALALAAGVLDALPVAGSTLDARLLRYEARANLRIPCGIIVRREEDW